MYDSFVIKDTVFVKVNTDVYYAVMEFPMSYDDFASYKCRTPMYALVRKDTGTISYICTNEKLVENRISMLKYDVDIWFNGYTKISILGYLKYVCFIVVVIVVVLLAIL